MTTPDKDMTAGERTPIRRRLRLPLPPSDNRAHRIVVDRTGRPRRVRADATVEYEALAGFLALQWARATGWDPPTAGVKVVVDVWVWWPDNRRRDPANLSKVLLDGLKGVLFPDDDTVLIRYQDYDIHRSDPRVEVAIYRKED